VNLRVNDAYQHLYWMQKLTRSLNCFISFLWNSINYATQAELGSWRPWFLTIIKPQLCGVFAEHLAVGGSGQ